MSTCTQRHFGDRERGAVLVISLIMLAVLTVLGLAGLTMSKLEERMARNFQHGMTVFQAAESAIASVITSGNPGGSGSNANPFYDVDADPLVAAINLGLNDSSTVVELDMDPSGHLGSADLETESTVIYRGVGPCPEASFGEIICYQFEIDTAASVSTTGARTRHIQSVERPAPGTGS